MVNIVTGAGETGAALAHHPDLDKSPSPAATEVGKIDRRSRAPGTGEKARPSELGGKAANIIFEDAPLDQAIEGIIAGIYFNQGHVCCAGSRLFVQEGIYPPSSRNCATASRPCAWAIRSTRTRTLARSIPAATGKNPRTGAERRG